MTLKTLIAATAMTLSASVAFAETHIVNIQGFAFEPATLTIAAGDTVTFVNQDGAPHTATANNGSFDTGRLSRGQEASLTFNSAGTYDYFCEVHPNMTATLIVE
ncbi:MAG: cupredoxin family copper-binding protein [Pseudomonadota bacterium]